ncbi:flippase [Lactobacillus delbrueckii subsp. lactis]|uniref:flippase n=10 Tax=Bacilli TaxID=91061 RepID=UPI0001EC32B6|nr:flippase [Lactobacillus delbrueckii]ADQ61810.1 MOP superfamily multidrug/oligosaccharidyl-lipid/polysaccharide flippase transporter [Lactobacillus delbrueckii subsp. bulgaricus ND02]MCD5438533.1 flippase [Lactobacillus delbrueckii subsp. lactis]MCD5469135.1 flippase [Lactobacillus delbrueckii subsp. lactis]MCZ0796203.1 flippase [Lactobacillus delbrueckii subsp. lactis]UBV30377.1 flippase [Lactobacillus delbrueckii subsp. lactis]
MRVVKNYLYNVGYQVLAIIVPLITSYYVSRVLSPEGVGANAFTNSIIQYFMLLANIGIGYYGNREIAYVRDNKQKMAATFWEIQIVKTVMTVVAYLSFVVFMAFYSGNKTYMWAQSINLIAVAFDISWLYQGLEDFKRTVLRNTFVKITSMIAIFIFIKSPKDVAVYIIVLALSTLLGNLTLWPHAVNNYGHVDRGTKLNPWRHFVPTVTMFVPQIATQLYVQLNRTMLGLMVDQKASGFYQYSDNLVKLILAFVTATGTVMLPHVANAFAQHDMEKVHKMLYKSFDFVSALAYPMMFGIAGVSLTLAPLYYSSKYAPVGPAMLIESIVILMIGWSNVIGTQYLLPVNRVKDFTTSVTIGAVVNIILNFPFISLWGLNGAMWATVLSEVAVTGYQLYVVRKDLDLSLMFQSSWKYLLASGVMFVAVFGMNTHLKASWLWLICEVAVGVVIYAGLVYFLKAPIIDQAKNLISKKLQK